MVTGSTDLEPGRAHYLHPFTESSQLCPDFTDEEAEAGRVSDVLKVRKAVSGGVQTPAPV